MPRPPRGDRPSLSLRTSPELRAKLEQAAAKSGRSISQEAEWLLERGMAVTGRSTGTQETNEFLAAVASAINNAERMRGKSWLEDTRLRKRINATVKALTDLMLPDRLGEDRREQIIAEHIFELSHMYDEDLYIFVQDMAESQGLQMPADTLVKVDGRLTINVARVIEWAAEVERQGETRPNA